MPTDGAAFADAVAAGRRGEIVLRALVILGSRDLAEADIAQLVQAIGGLGAVGLEQDARAIAVAAGISGGL